MRSMWNCMIWGGWVDADTHTHTHNRTNRCMYSMCCFPRAYIMRNSMRKRKNLPHFYFFLRNHFSVFFLKKGWFWTYIFVEDEHLLVISNTANMNWYLIQSMMMMMIVGEIHVIPFPLNLSLCLCVFILHSSETEERYISFGISSTQRKNWKEGSYSPSNKFPPSHTRPQHGRTAAEQQQQQQQQAGNSYNNNSTNVLIQKPAKHWLGLADTKRREGEGERETPSKLFTQYFLG